MRILAPDVSRRVPWRNGLGATLEIATDAAVPGGEWTWRLSIADIAGRVPFSAFPGIDRFIACLAGPGLNLERAGAHALAPREGEALAFSGEEVVTGSPLGPGVSDVNLMLRRDRWRGRMVLVRGRALALEAPLVLVHAPAHSAVLRVESVEGGCELAPGSTLVAHGRVAILGAPASICVACELSVV